VSPSRFIRCAEQTGLIVPVGQWVIEEACRQARALRSHGHAGVRVAVNVSAAQFLRGDLVDGVAQAMRSSDLAPGQLELELTESVLMRDTSRIAGELSALRSLGDRPAIDDFGTGYSSLSYLQHLPIDVLKIDQSFVRGIGSSTHVRGGELVRSIIHLGHSLGLELVAEGVETGEQAAWLFGAGCEVAQGFWFARPAPLSTFLADPPLAHTERLSIAIP
jgi:EAL domain-containing protein (putative c-di-GMP-specific phosphodiesterase class I)